MSKSISRPEDLQKYAKKRTPRCIKLCAGAGCIASGAMEVKRALLDSMEENDLDIPVVETGCLGPCASGPVLMVEPDGVIYQGLDAGSAEDIIETHFKKSTIVEALLFRDTHDDNPPQTAEETEFFKHQQKVVLRNCGTVDPADITDYFRVRGYEALGKAVTQMKQDNVIETMKGSGLKGRGGAGFPTWMKWAFTKKAEDNVKYVLCNADEGDPGAFMDRSVLEGDPHSVIEGMAIAAYTVGAQEGFVYVRAEYPLAVSRLTHAINEAREWGLLGKNIMGSSFSFNLNIRMGSGAFVCGEETALIASIEGKRGEPRPRPPFPAQKGLWGKPTLLNNVETYANVAAIVLHGADWYNQFGTEASPGTKVFALAGSVGMAGLVEVPIGMSLGEVIYDIGGGIKGGKQFKAAQIGGPSGGCIPKQHLDVALDYESLKELGAITGSGGLIVMDDDSCMVDVARFFLEFVQEESCGKCVPCRVGTKRMLEILERICNGHGQESDIERLIELGKQIQDTALCGLGQTAPNPVLSTIRHFEDEYIAHIRDKQCPAGVCPALVRAPCQSACPAGVDIPGFVSLTGEKRYAEALKLHRERNPFAAVCARVCFHTCEDKCRRSTLDEPVSVRGIKRFMVDQEVTIQLPEIKENTENAAKKIAIVGAGPAGLSCAYFLARLGYRPEVFEASPRPGGMLVQAIPAYRLPRETLAREIRMIENMGVIIHTEKALGKDFSLESLKADGYDAVFLGVGAPENMNMGIDGEDSEGVVLSGDFLGQYNIRGSVPVGKTVAVVGGGNAAIDAARTALRLGAESVKIIYRRTQEQMPAYDEEIEEALHEGVELLTLTQPMEVVKDKNGKVAGIKCAPMELGDFDRSGRRRPTSSDAAMETIECDQIIVAIGQWLNTKPVFGKTDVAMNDRGFIRVNYVNGQTSTDWLFSGGDATTGPSSVVEAIGAGERAAVGMDEFLSGENHAFWREEQAVDTVFDPDAEPVTHQREALPTIPVERRKHNFEEVEQPWIEHSAMRQCNRCLRCDYGKTPGTRTPKKESAHA